jgi:hypothetical protein
MELVLSLWTAVELIQAATRSGVPSRQPTPLSESPKHRSLPASSIVPGGAARNRAQSGNPADLPLPSNGSPNRRSLWISAKLTRANEPKALGSRPRSLCKTARVDILTIIHVGILSSAEARVGRDPALRCSYARSDVVDTMSSPLTTAALAPGCAPRRILGSVGRRLPACEQVEAGSTNDEEQSLLAGPSSKHEHRPGDHRSAHCRSVCSGLPERPLGLVVVHDDVDVLGRVDRREVEPLGRDVALAPAPFDFGAR